MECHAKPYEGTDKYLFISYARKDAWLVYPFIERLARRGCRVWYDSGIHVGSRWPEVIAQHLKDCEACVVFMTPNSMASDNCGNELIFAKDSGKPIIPIRWNDTTLTLATQLMLGATQWTEIRELPTDADIDRILSIDAVRNCHGLQDMSIQVQDYVFPKQKAEVRQESEFVDLFQQAAMEEETSGGSENEESAPGEQEPQAGQPEMPSQPRETAGTAPAAEPAETENPETQPAGENEEQKPAEEPEDPAAEPEEEPAPAGETGKKRRRRRCDTEKVTAAAPSPSPASPSVPKPSPAPAPVPSPVPRPRPEPAPLPAPSGGWNGRTKPAEEIAWDAEDENEKTVAQDPEDELEKTVTMERMTLPTIVILADGRRYRGKPGITILGRSKKTSDICVSDPERRVSGKHLKIVCMEGIQAVEDLNSTNGTWLDGQALEAGKPVSVRQVCEVTLARTGILLAFGPEAESLWRAPSLLCLRCEETGETRFLWEGEMNLGRSHPWRNHVLESKEISHAHAAVFQAADGWRIRDNSRNGTWLDGERMEPRGESILETGDIIGIGEHRFVVTILRMDRGGMAG